jgi:hypothetical protein
MLLLSLFSSSSTASMTTVVAAFLFFWGGGPEPSESDAIVKADFGLALSFADRFGRRDLASSPDVAEGAFGGRDDVDARGAGGFLTLMDVFGIADIFGITGMANSSSPNNSVHR